MKVYAETPSTLSQAMFRVTNALKRYAPISVDFISSPERADLEIVHVIGNDALDYQSKAKRFVVIHYCLNGGSPVPWHPLWSRAALVWSYFDLRRCMPKDAHFYFAPLGIDPAFVREQPRVPRTIDLVTSGYVTGRERFAEAIEEAAHAVAAIHGTTRHIGPAPVGLTKPLPEGWMSLRGISDEMLAAVYSSSKWVSGLRFREGFEMPVIEGLACGARPIVFDRPDMRRWYEDHAVFVPEIDGNDLIECLIDVLNHPPAPVSLSERQAVLAKFGWKEIVTNLWSQIL